MRRCNALGRRFAAVILAVSVLGLVGCQWRLIAGQSWEIVDAVDKLHDKIYTFVVKLDRHLDEPEGEYRNNSKFYDELRIDLEALRFRAATHLQNRETVRQIDLLADTLKIFEEMHAGGLTREELALVWRNISLQLRLINTLEKHKPFRFGE